MATFGRAVVLPALLLLVVVAGGGCTQLGYYAQSVSGQLEVLRLREPIEQLLEDPATPMQLRAKLQTVLQIREFASRELQLPDNESYRSYADLKRKYVVWNVFASPELSLEPQRWCFLFVGCVVYRGYFSEQDAHRFASSQSQSGLDVHVAGVAAYSTLGWFDDPVLNTFITRSNTALAALIFHELAHQELYVKNDTDFNEGFAVAVEREGVRRWLQAHGTSQDWSAYEAAMQRRMDFESMIALARDRLGAIYASAAENAEKRERKARVIEQLRDAYRVRASEREDFAVYADWFSGPINNAKLNAVAAYSSEVPAFTALLGQTGGDLGEFYARAREIGALDAEQRRGELRRLAAGAAAARTGAQVRRASLR